MGVPAFFRWLSKKYVSIIVDSVEERNRDVDGVRVPVDCTKPNPNFQEFDNLYLDMNGIIHPCTHPEDRPAPKNEEEMFILIFEYIDRLFSIVRPRKVLYMAIDGVAPRAKMNQQRSRRFRAAKEAEDKKQQIQAVRDRLAKEGIPLPPPKKEEEHFDSNCITPGTPFMDRLAVALRYYIHQRVTTDPAWQTIQVILSDANVPGEGEHKIMDYIRRQRASPSHNPNTVHCLCGADADLIMLGLATHEPNFNILREEFVPNQPRACELCGQYGHELQNCKGLARDEAGPDQVDPLKKEKNFIFIRLSVLREYLERELTMPNLPFEYDFERAVDDWVFMCFFVGNDFLPHLPSLEIRENAIDRLIKLYKDMVYQCKGWLTEDGDVYMDRVEMMMIELGKVEDEIFKTRQMKDLRYKENNKQRRRRERAAASRNMQSRSFTHSAEYSSSPNYGGGYSSNRHSYSGFVQNSDNSPASWDNQYSNQQYINQQQWSQVDYNVRPAPLSGMPPPLMSVPPPRIPYHRDNSQGYGAPPSQYYGGFYGGPPPPVPPQFGRQMLHARGSNGRHRGNRPFIPHNASLIAPVSQAPAYMSGLETRQRAAEDRLKVIMGMKRPADGSPGAPPAKSYKDASGGRSDRRNNGDFGDSEEEEEPEDEIRLWEDGWKDRYYKAKFGENDNNVEFRRKVAWAYTEGLCWVLKYYYQGCVSWTWYYPFHYAPFASDFDTISQYKPDFSLTTKPFNPLEQLMGVFPAASRSHIPEGWRSLMTDENSPIFDFYPADFEIDLNGKKFAWQGVALLPFVDEKRLLDALKDVYDTLTPEEIRRNCSGTDRLFVGRKHSAFSSLVEVHKSGKETENKDESGRIIHNWVYLDATLTYGMAGEIACDIDGVEVDACYPSVFRNSVEFRDIKANSCIMVAFRDPQFPESFVFKAERLHGAVDPERVVKPGDWDERRNGNFQPQIGFSRNIGHANISVAGHRALQHAIHDQRTSY
ncbi:5'-3' exoribonuclease 2 like protein [Ditylenchus destructor]|uniref:5'-3' exoribonuclease n=1 Tax=Ditylenchus destructor TaxID=166010 RepID=A0AAD4R7C9_9BILA|nr:5'-3' exoribonuclease 2 like protein [Ditylenchus destructor]